MLRLLAVLLSIAIVAPRLAGADVVTEPYTPITRINLQRAPFDACLQSCTDAAEQERARLGPEPTAPRYRLSAIQAATSRGILVANFATQNGISTADADGLVPSWDEAVSEWRDAEPKGDYNSNDLADVFAKYWLFSFMFGAGLTPDKIPEPVRAAVRLQAHRLFAADPVLKLLTEGQRQGLADTLIRVQTADYLALMVSADPQKIGPVMYEVARQFQEQFGLDVAKLGLTPDQGFVLRNTQ
jgi:hypothetical protein